MLKKENDKQQKMISDLTLGEFDMVEKIGIRHTEHKKTEKATKNLISSLKTQNNSYLNEDNNTAHDNDATMKTKMKLSLPLSKSNWL